MSLFLPIIIEGATEVGAFQPFSHWSQCCCLEILATCVQDHPVSTRQFLKQFHTLQKVSEQISPRWDSHSSTHLRLSLLRFLRTCIGVKDYALIDLCVQEKVLDSVVDAFLSNGARYNMLNSAVIELMEFIRRENIKPLIRYLIENHYMDKLDSITYVSTFSLLRQRYLDSEENDSNYNVDLKRDHDFDLSEERYFEKEDDESEAADYHPPEVSRGDFLDRSEFLEKNTFDDDFDITKRLGEKKRVRADNLLSGKGSKKAKIHISVSSGRG